MYLRHLELNSNDFPAQNKFPFSLDVFRKTRQVSFKSPITFLVGDNGTGKSSLLDAIARKSGLLPWGGSKVHRVHDNPYETQLASYLELHYEPRHPYGFYFRAETFFNFAGSLDDILMDDPNRDEYYGGGSLNTLSHGESFLSFFRGYSFQLDGLYLIDEPEAALSPANQVEFGKLILKASEMGNRQFIVASHSPIILACPKAIILSFDEPPIREIGYRETKSYTFYRGFLENPEHHYERL